MESSRYSIIYAPAVERTNPPATAIKTTNNILGPMGYRGTLAGSNTEMVLMAELPVVVNRLA